MARVIFTGPAQERDFGPLGAAVGQGFGDHLGRRQTGLALLELEQARIALQERGIDPDSPQGRLVLETLVGEGATTPPVPAAAPPFLAAQNPPSPFAGASHGAQAPPAGAQPSPLAQGAPGAAQSDPRAALLAKFAKNPELLADAETYKALKALTPETKDKPGFTLGPGQTRFDAQGRPVAEMPKEVEPQKFTRVVEASSRLNEQFGLGLTRGQRGLVEFTRDPATGALTTGSVKSVVEPKDVKGLARIQAEAQARAQGTALGTPQVQTLSPADLERMGLDPPPGTIVQRKPDGTLVTTPLFSAGERERNAQRASLAQALMGRGIPEAEADRLARRAVEGNLKIEVDPTGVVNLIDQEKALAGDPEAVRILPQVPPPATTPSLPPEDTVMAKVMNATGLQSGLLAFTSRLPGTTPSPTERDVVAARQSLSLLSNEVARGLANSKLFAVREREAILKQIDTIPQLFDSPAALTVRLVNLSRELDTRRRLAEATANNFGLSAPDRAEARASAQDLRNVIALMGVPEITPETVDALPITELNKLAGAVTDAELNALPPEVQQRLEERLSAQQ